MFIALAYIHAIQNANGNWILWLYMYHSHSGLDNLNSWLPQIFQRQSIQTTYSHLIALLLVLHRPYVVVIVIKRFDIRQNITAAQAQAQDKFIGIQISFMLPLWHKILFIWNLRLYSGTQVFQHLLLEMQVIKFMMW